MNNKEQEYFEKLRVAVVPSERELLANDPECPISVLRVFCEVEVEQTVVECAVLNPNTPDDAVQIALARFPSLDNKRLIEIREKKKWALAIADEIKELEEESKKNISGDRDQILMSHILKKKEHLKKQSHSTLHLGKPHSADNIVFKNPHIEWADTNKFRVALIMLPAWGVLFPPYGLAKITGVLRKNDYSVKVYDLNVETYHWFLENHGQDYWRSERYFLWEDNDNFEKYLLPDLIPILDKVIDDIIVSNVKVIGFSIFATNRNAVLYMARILRKLVPDICMIVGGPDTVATPHTFREKGANLFNYIFIGEAEENLLNVLENLPEKPPMNEYVGDTKSRLNLDVFAYPDYTDYDIKNYLDHGVSIETSRGCVAQCSFCAETYFWKFRSLTPERVVDEMEYQIKHHKVKRFWFVDSLVNGNVKNFEKLLDIMNERNLDINWNSYARCDGRMDFNFFRKILKSGCTALSFGVESGSQKVLDDMRKKITVKEIEDNLRDGKRVRLWNHVNWLIGFPTEEAIDYFHSMQLLYNVRKWIHAISPGFGTGLAANSDIQNNFKLYKIVGEKQTYDTTFLQQWYTEGYKNTIVHRFIRIKLTHIWLSLLVKHTHSVITNGQSYEGLGKFYTFEFGKIKIKEYEPQDFNVNFYQGPEFKDGIVEEFVGFCYLLYKYFRKCKFTIMFDPELDLKLFGDIIVKKYKCDLKFEVEDNGDYVFEIDHSLEHATDDENLKYFYERERLNGDKSFKDAFVKRGNISDWQTAEPQVRESIHEQYRRKQ